MGQRRTRPALSYLCMSPLTGLRVLDFSHALAGPYCTMLLAQYGAEILKIEDPASGDVGRSWGPPFIGDEASYFLGLNAGKRSLAIDLKKPEGLALCLDLAQHADILIENMRPGTMTRIGLGYEAVRARNPRLIYCAVSGYGQTGPSRDDAAMDLIVQASSGLISTTGVEGGERVRSGHSVADITAGMFAVIGIQLALEARHKTGQGQFVDVAMMDGMISAMASNYAFYFGSGIVPEPMGTRFATIVPYRGFPTKDREIVIAVASQKLWRTFCTALGRPDLADHPNFATNSRRVDNRKVLEPLITEILRTRPSAEWCKLFAEFGIPCSPVRNLEEVVNDPQSTAREMFPEAGTTRITGPPVKLSATPGAAQQPAPKLGADTRMALAELLNLNETALEALAKSGAIA
jgi:crotonobetainyl-CoA:carnitine CoA-transferase CaiB-like acyl-CoA transferase